jgi:hypothetical protein
MSWTHFTIPPNSGKTGDKAAQLRRPLNRFGLAHSDFKPRQQSLRFSNLAQQSNRVQGR